MGYQPILVQNLPADFLELIVWYSPFNGYIFTGFMDGICGSGIIMIKAAMPPNLMQNKFWFELFEKNK